MTPQEAKQKAIIEAYGNKFEQYESDIDGNGWFNCGYCTNGADDAEEVILEQLNMILKDGEYYSTGDVEAGFMYWRPKSLQGIETNNGWIKIEPDGSNLPKSGRTFRVYRTDGHESNIIHSWTYLKDLFEDGTITHYRESEKPQPPIY